MTKKMDSGTTTRIAYHEGSWYSSNPEELRSELDGWITTAAASKTLDVSNGGTVRAIISPHAGYKYSGSTAAFAYGALNPQEIERVFILGPSHHHYLK